MALAYTLASMPQDTLATKGEVRGTCLPFQLWPTGHSKGRALKLLIFRIEREWGLISFHCHPLEWMAGVGASSLGGESLVFRGSRLQHHSILRYRSS